MTTLQLGIEEEALMIEALHTRIRWVEKFIAEVLDKQSDADTILRDYYEKDLAKLNALLGYVKKQMLTF
jgi:hypothetical protein